MGTPERRGDVEIHRPNRDKAASKATRATVVLLLLASAGLLIIISVGGWSTLQGAKPVQVGYILLYLGMAYLLMRWNRGVLPVAAALAIILGIFAAVSGPDWFDRDKTGFTDPAIPSSVLGLLVLILVPVQLLLIAFAMRGFQQEWNVEIERPVGGGGYAPGDADSRGEPAPA
jgi:presenilin-like A22 family membrane protease